MKILIVSPTHYEFPTRVGGAETYIKNLSKALAINPEVTKVGILSFSSSKAGKWFSDNVIYKISKAYLIKKNPSNPFPVFNYFELIKWDVIYLQQYHTWLTFIVILLSKLFNKKVVLTDHNGGGATYNRRFNIDRQIDLFLSTSKLSFNEINLKPKKMSVIYGGVDLDTFQPVASTKNGILFVGRAHKIKGIIPFLKSAIESNYTGKITLSLGVNFENTEHYYEITHFIKTNNLQNVVIKKNLSTVELAKEYQNHSWTVLPSLDEKPHESLGLTILESLASGTSVAVSPYCGVCEMLPENLSFAHILKNQNDFFKNKANLIEHGNDARIWAEENASWKHVADRAVKEIKTL